MTGSMHLWHLEADTPRLPAVVEAGAAVLACVNLARELGQSVWAAIDVKSATGRRRQEIRKGRWCRNEGPNSYWEIDLGGSTPATWRAYQVLGEDESGVVVATRRFELRVAGEPVRDLAANPFSSQGSPMRPRALLALGAALAWVAPLPVAGAPVRPSAPSRWWILNVHLPYQLARGRPCSRPAGRRTRAACVRVGCSARSCRCSRLRGAAIEPAYHATYRALAAGDGLRIPGCRRAGPGVRTWLALEGGETLARAPTPSAGLWVDRGVRFFGLVHDRDGALATSAATPGPVLTGLTPLGREAVESVHAAGGVIDVSRASEMAVRDVIEIARATGRVVIASHANARALADHPQNLTDSQLMEHRAHRRRGGHHVQPQAAGPRPRGRACRRRGARPSRGQGRGGRRGGHRLGLRRGRAPAARALERRALPRLARALGDAGMTRDEVRKVLSGNALRVLCPSRKR